VKNTDVALNPTRRAWRNRQDTAMRGEAMKIVVIGGTGLIGSKVVQKLEQKGHQAIAAAPNTGVNTITGKGLAEALAGAEVVVDVANSPSFEDQVAMEFFQTAGRNLIAAEVAAGIKHHVALSVVGTDRLQDSGYFRAKLAQEGIIKSSPIPYTIVRATQFCEFLRGIAQSATEGETVRLPHALFQPMAAQDVATAVADAALAAPANGTVEVAGPDAFHMDVAVARVLEHDKDQRKVITDPSALYYGVKLTDRSLVPSIHPRFASTDLDWWLAHVPPPANKQPLTKST
jgi:uncharacterized protein YbjT (DUF2867 family)